MGFFDDLKDKASNLGTAQIDKFCAERVQKATEQIIQDLKADPLNALKRYGISLEKLGLDSSILKSASKLSPFMVIRSKRYRTKRSTRKMKSKRSSRKMKSKRSSRKMKSKRSSRKMKSKRSSRKIRYRFAPKQALGVYKTDAKGNEYLEYKKQMNNGSSYTLKEFT